MNIRINLKAIGQLMALNVLCFGVLTAAGESMESAAAVVSFAAVFFQLVSRNFRALCASALGLSV